MALDLALPISPALAITYLLNTVLAFAVVVLSDRIIAHEIEAKRLLIIAVFSLFIAPMLAPFIGIFDRGMAIILSFVVWVILGEVLLREDAQTKFKIMGIAFLVYYILSIYFMDAIQGSLRIYMPF